MQLSLWFFLEAVNLENRKILFLICVVWLLINRFIAFLAVQLAGIHVNGKIRSFYRLTSKNLFSVKSIWLWFVWLFFKFFFDGLDKWCRFGCSETRHQNHHHHLHQKCDARFGLACLANTGLKVDNQWIYISKFSHPCGNTLSLGDWGKTKHFGNLCFACKQQIPHWNLHLGVRPLGRLHSISNYLSFWQAAVTFICVCLTSIASLEFCFKSEKKLHVQIDSDFSVYFNVFFVLTWLQDLLPISGLISN